MLGKGYESLTLETIETALAQGIRMPGIESIHELRATLNDVNHSIANLERQLATERDAEARVNFASRWRPTTKHKLTPKAASARGLDHAAKGRS